MSADFTQESGGNFSSWQKMFKITVSKTGTPPSFSVLENDAAKGKTYACTSHLGVHCIYGTYVIPSVAEVLIQNKRTMPSGPAQPQGSSSSNNFLTSPEQKANAVNTAFGKHDCGIVRLSLHCLLSNTFAKRKSFSLGQCIRDPWAWERVVQSHPHQREQSSK